MYRVVRLYIFFFFNDTATTEIYTLSLHDALPILQEIKQIYSHIDILVNNAAIHYPQNDIRKITAAQLEKTFRSEEHTSELQSRLHLVCRLLLEKKKTDHIEPRAHILKWHAHSPRL